MCDVYILVSVFHIDESKLKLVNFQALFGLNFTLFYVRCLYVSVCIFY